MIRLSHLQLRAATLLVLTALFCGCGGSPAVRYYTLGSAQPPAPRDSGASPGEDFSVGVGPVDIPDYLEGPRIVTRSGGNEMLLAEYDRWAGSLRQDFARVLMENLSVRLPPRTTVFSWKRHLPMDCRVAIEVTRLDVIPGRAVVLCAQWTLFAREQKVPVRSRAQTFTEPLPDRDMGAAVSRMGKAVARLSEAIAVDIEDVVSRELAQSGRSGSR